jgi:hypothetical protein
MGKHGIELLSQLQNLLSEVLNVKYSKFHI